MHEDEGEKYKINAHILFPLKRTKSVHGYLMHEYIISNKVMIL